MIFVALLYCSGTDDIPALIARQLRSAPEVRFAPRADDRARVRAPDAAVSRLNTQSAPCTRHHRATRVEASRRRRNVRPSNQRAHAPSSRHRRRSAAVDQRHVPVGASACPCRSCRAPQVHDDELPDRSWRHAASGDGGLRHLRTPQCGARQCGAAAIALHGQSSRLRVADRTRHGARHCTTVPRRDGTVRERRIVIAQQHA